jgi:hypothetical protein
MTDEETKGLTDEEKGCAIGQILGEVNPYLSIRDLVQYMDVLIVVCACQDRQPFAHGIGRGYENVAYQRKLQARAARHRGQKGTERQ